MAINIFNSRFHHKSKKDKVLAAIHDPINKPLLQKIADYVEVDDNGEVKYVEELHVDEVLKTEPIDVDGEISAEDELDDDIEDIDDVEEEFDEVEEDIEEASKVSKSQPIESTTQVSVEDAISQAINEIPGMLNLESTTFGVVDIKVEGPANNEVWIYYKEDVDLSDILMNVTNKIQASGYNFLVFNKVDRDKHAIVFTAAITSSYYSMPKETESDES